MAKSSSITQAFALLTALSLSLPNSALALRPKEPREDPKRKSGMEEALRPAAGAEELDPKVREVLFAFQSETDERKRLSTLETYLRDFQPPQRVQFLEALPWLPDQQKVSGLLVTAFTDDSTLARDLRNYLLTAAGDGFKSPASDPRSIFRLLLIRMDWKDASSITQAITEAISEKRKPLGPEWEGLVPVLPLAIFVGAMESTIRGFRERAAIDDRDLYHRMALAHEVLANTYKSLKETVPEATDLQSVERAFLFLHEAIAQSLSPLGENARLILDSVKNGNADNAYAFVNKALQQELHKSLRPEARLIALGWLAELEQTYADFLKILGRAKSDWMGHYVRATQLRQEQEILIRERRQALQLPLAAGVEEGGKELISGGRGVPGVAISSRDNPTLPRRVSESQLPRSQTKDHIPSSSVLLRVWTQPEGYSQHAGVQDQSHPERPSPERIVSDERTKDQPTQNDRPGIGQEPDQRSFLSGGEPHPTQVYQGVPLLSNVSTRIGFTINKNSSIINNIPAAGAEEELTPAVREGLHRLADHVLSILYDQTLSQPIEKVIDSENIGNFIEAAIQYYLQLPGYGKDAPGVAGPWRAILSDEMIGPDGVLRKNPDLYAKAIFLHLEHQGVERLLRGIALSNEGLPKDHPLIVDSRFGYFANTWIRLARGIDPQTAGAEEITRDRVAQAVEQFRAEQDSTKAIDPDLIYYLEGEGTAFAPALALLEVGKQLDLYSFVGVVETRRDYDRLAAVLGSNPAAQKMLQTRILVVEEQPGTDRQQRYDIALKKLSVVMSGMNIRKVITLEPDLLAQLNRILAGFGYHLPDDATVREAAAILIRAA